MRVVYSDADFACSTFFGGAASWLCEIMGLPARCALLTVCNVMLVWICELVIRIVCGPVERAHRPSHVPDVCVWRAGVRGAYLVSTCRNPRGWCVM